VSSSDPQAPAAPADSGQPSTKEIPVVPPGGATAAGKNLPPHPDAVAPAALPVDAPQPTGPVDFVPGLPGLGTPPAPSHGVPAPPPPVPPRQVPGSADGEPTTVAGPIWPDTLDAEEPAKPRAKRIRTPRDRSALLGLGLVVLALVLLELGLTGDFGGESYWSTVPLWSGFATVCTVLGLGAVAAALPLATRLSSGPGWRVAAAGLVGLAVFWLLVVLPVVDSDRGFVLTMALVALGGAVWVGARTRA
jgi:hypothetical protein